MFPVQDQTRAPDEAGITNWSNGEHTAGTPPPIHPDGAEAGMAPGARAGRRQKGAKGELNSDSLPKGESYH